MSKCRKRNKEHSPAAKSGGGSSAPSVLEHQVSPCLPPLGSDLLAPPPASAQAVTPPLLPVLPPSMFSQYGSNFTPEGNVFSSLGEIVRAASLPQPEVPSLLTTDSSPSTLAPVSCEPASSVVTSELMEADSAISRERRSKKFHDRPAKVGSLVRARSSGSLQGTEIPAPSSTLAPGELGSAPAVPGLAAPVARGLRSTALQVETVRKGARGASLADKRVLDRAVRLTAEKNATACNAPSTSKRQPKGKTLDPIFAILQDLPDSHLLSVAADSCVSFPPSSVPPAEALSLIRANELAQAELAAARAKSDSEKAMALAAGPPGGNPIAPMDGLCTQPGAEIGVSAPPEESSDARAHSPSPRKANPRRRSKSAVPQGRRPVTRLARAQGKVSQ